MQYLKHYLIKFFTFVVLKNFHFLNQYERELYTTYISLGPVPLILDTYRMMKHGFGLRKFSCHDSQVGCRVEAKWPTKYQQLYCTYHNHNYTRTLLEKPSVTQDQTCTYVTENSAIHTGRSEKSVIHIQIGPLNQCG
jgi:hypothetical protein